MIFTTIHKEQQDTPTGSPEAGAATPTNGTYIEVIVDGVLQVFHHLGLLHELVLVMVHAHKETNMGKDILKGIHKLEGVCKLEGINVAKLELDMGINDM